LDGKIYSYVWLTVFDPEYECDKEFKRTSYLLVDTLGIIAKVGDRIEIKKMAT